MSIKSSSFSIKSWSQDDQPREKLRDKGKMVLTNAELIAILIGSGNRKESAVGLSKRILASVDHHLNALGKLSVEQLKSFHGIGEAKAITIIAALELGRRRRESAELQQDTIHSSRSVFNLMVPWIGELPHEEFWIIYLNTSNKILEKRQMSKGGITGTVVDIRLVLKQAILVSAVGVILVHNHPSGNTKPSEADKQLTQRLKTAAEHLDIKVLDHVIVTRDAYFSFADEGMI